LRECSGYAISNEAKNPLPFEKTAFLSDDSGFGGHPEHGSQQALAAHKIHRLYGKSPAAPEKPAYLVKESGSPKGIASVRLSPDRGTPACRHVGKSTLMLSRERAMIEAG